MIKQKYQQIIIDDVVYFDKMRKQNSYYEIYHFIQIMVRIIDNYTLYETIGEGAYGKVYRAVNKIDNKEYAVKVIEVKKFLTNKKLEECTVHEINILTNIEKNQHIITYYDMLKTQNNFYFVYEYCNGGTLEGMLRKQHTLDEKGALLIFKQLIQAFQVLNKYNIMHRDLKPDNIFFHNGIIKVGDFGFCKSLQKAEMTKTMLGSPIYMAPQILNGQIYSNKADIWSIGVVLYEMLYGYCPFESNSIPKLIEVLKDTELQFPSEIQVSDQTKRLLKRILTKDPQKRIEWMELFQLRISNDGKLLSQNTGRTTLVGDSSDLISSIKEVKQTISQENSPTSFTNNAQLTSSIRQTSYNSQGFSSPRNMLNDPGFNKTQKVDDKQKVGFLRKAKTIDEAQTVSPYKPRKNLQKQGGPLRDKVGKFHSDMVRGINIARSMALNQERSTPIFSYFLLKAVSDKIKAFKEEELSVPSINSNETQQFNQIFNEELEQLESQIGNLKGKIEEFPDWKKAVKSKMLEFRSMRLCYQFVIFMCGQASNQNISHNEMSYAIRSKIA